MVGITNYNLTLEWWSKKHSENKITNKILTFGWVGSRFDYILNTSLLKIFLDRSRKVKSIIIDKYVDSTRDGI